MADDFPLPFCSECGWTAPGHVVPDRTYMRAWGIAGTVYMAGAFDWRSFPEFRCGCRIVWEAREKGLIDEACGGHGPGPWTPERLVGAKIKQAAAELQKVIADGIWDWSPARLQRAREERADLDAKIEASRKRWEGISW